MKSEQNIYLTGFMGCGKTTVGKLLARKLNRNFVDADARIEKSARMSITEIFETLGEAHFRKLEQDVIKDLSQKTQLVASLGGGVMNGENKKLLRKGVWIFLDTPFPVISKRVMKHKHRPLAKDETALKKLYEQRLPSYRQASLTISGLGTPDDICQRILKDLVTTAHENAEGPS